jgi:hypothetical protein
MLPLANRKEFAGQYVTVTIIIVIDIIAMATIIKGTVTIKDTLNHSVSTDQIKGIAVAPVKYLLAV